METRRLTPALAKTIAQEFASKCKQRGWRFSVRDSVVSVSKNFTPGDRDGFVACDGGYWDLLSGLRAKGGSCWGTDGSGVGAFGAIERGRFVQNLSGVPSLVCKALQKETAAESAE